MDRRSFIIHMVIGEVNVKEVSSVMRHKDAGKINNSFSNYQKNYYDQQTGMTLLLKCFLWKAWKIIRD